METPPASEGSTNSSTAKSIYVVASLNHNKICLGRTLGIYFTQRHRTLFAAAPSDMLRQGE